MLAHIIGSSIGFRDGAAKVDGPTTSTPPGPASRELGYGIPEDPEARAGLFCPRVLVSDDAPLLDRILSYAGRRPFWTA